MPTPEADTARDSSLFDQNLWTCDDAYLTTLGWGHWASGNPLRLCPVDQWKAVPTGMRVVCISGASKVVGRDYIDDDYRGGMLAYGIVPGEVMAETAPSAVGVAAADEAQQRALIEMAAPLAMITPDGMSEDVDDNRALLYLIAGIDPDPAPVTRESLLMED